MKILMVSMSSIHFFRWTEQLKNAGHQVFWFDILGSGRKVEKINWVHQFVDWKLRWNYPGRIFIKKNIPLAHKFIQKINDRNTTTQFEKVLKQVQPDVVHSFALYVSCTPILSVMNRYKNIKWIYSSWGSDLFYFQHIPGYLKDIKKVLSKIDYLFTDCKRDFDIAKKLGFNGEFLGVFPGGGGFEIKKFNRYKMPLPKRKIILVKGYQGRSGRAIPIIKALEKLSKELNEYEIVVFGADTAVFDYVKQKKLNQNNNFKIFKKLPYQDIIKLMGKSLIYIGNSNSDGIPNTLIEAICMGVFPIQSNPGGATEEIIQNNTNGLLINDCENIEEIKSLMLKVLSASKLIESAFLINQNEAKNQFDREKVKQKVLLKYSKIKV